MLDALKKIFLVSGISLFLVSCSGLTQTQKELIEEVKQESGTVLSPKLVKEFYNIKDLNIYEKTQIDPHLFVVNNFINTRLERIVNLSVTEYENLYAQVYKLMLSYPTGNNLGNFKKAASSVINSRYKAVDVHYIAKQCSNNNYYEVSLHNVPRSILNSNDTFLWNIYLEYLNSTRTGFCQMAEYASQSLLKKIKY